MVRTGIVFVFIEVGLLGNGGVWLFPCFFLSFISTTCLLTDKLGF